MGKVEQDCEVKCFDHMKKNVYRKFALISVMLGLLVGCSSVTPNPPQPLVESPTITVSTPTLAPTTTSTPRPTATKKPATPTLTPEPGLQTNGPYLAYFQQRNGIQRIVFMDADGMGRRVIDLPKTIGVKSLDMRRVSPDGRWLAFYTGNAGKYGELPTVGVFDLALNLLNLETGEMEVITPLLSEDYPQNFVQAAQQLNDPNIAADSLYQAFVDGITRTIAWSPDGKYLTFGGQMDGLSSDLYLYSVETKTIQRLSSGDQELQWISWSPDGRWIVHSSVYGVGLGMTYDIYAASVDGFLQYLSTNVLDEGIEKWLHGHQYFEHDGENGPGEYGLRLIDAETGKIKRIWDGSFYWYAVDKRGMWAAVLASSPNEPPKFDENGFYVFDFDSDFVPAIYLINLETLEKSRVKLPDPGSIETFGLDGRDFVISSGENTVFLSIDGSLSETDLGNANFSVSPNSEYWLAVTGKMVKIFSANGTLVKDNKVSFPNGFKITWRPDSSGVLFFSGSKIYSMNVPDGDIHAVEMNLLPSEGLSYQWINGQ